MEKQKLLQYVAPCSMLCYTCMAYKDGAFAECGPRMNAYCEGVCEFLTEVCQLPGEEKEKHEAFHVTGRKSCRKGK